MGERYLTVKEVAEKLSCSQASIWRWRRLGILPEPVKLAQKTLWPENELEAWLEATRVVGRPTPKK